MNIIVTSPNLNEKYNISGISSIVSNFVKGQEEDYTIFITGKKDKERRDFKWLKKQLILLRKYYNLLNEKKIDIVHINTAFSSLSIIRDYFLVLIAKSKKIKIVLHIHGGKYLFVNKKPVLLNIFIRNSLRMSDAIIVLSRLEKEFLTFHYKISNLNVLPNSIYVPNYLTAFNERKNVAIFMGRIVKDKGIEDIIEAFRILNEFHIEIYFELCGVGADIALYEKSLKSILGFRYRNNGVVFGDEKWKLLNQSKLFLLPSYYEGFPMALLEAMSAGCVPIVTSVGSISEIIRHNINGLIVNKCAPKEIADSILCIINNHKLAEMISNNATKTILENYNIDKYKKKLFDIYQNLFH